MSTTVYFDCPVRSTHGGSVETFSFHPQYPLLAVSLSNSTNDASASGVVSIYDQSGYPLPGADVRQDETCAGVLSWHPSKRFLAMGWKNGFLSVRSEDQNSVTHTVDKQHLTAISTLCWVDVVPGAAVARLISADKNGQVMIWKYDLRSKTAPSVMCHCNAKDFGTINCSVMRTLSQSVHDMATLAKAAAEGDERALEMLVSGRVKAQRSNSPDTISCFLGSEHGHIFHMDEKGNYVVLFDSNQYGAGGVQKLLLSPSQQVLVAVTNSFTIYAFAVSGNTLKETGSVRLPGVTAAAADVIWAGDSAVAIPTGQTVIRMFCTLTFANFTLELPSKQNNKAAASVFDPSGDESSGVASADAVLSVTYSQHTKLLVASTKNGRLYFWRYQPHRTFPSSLSADSVDPDYDFEADWVLEKAVDAAKEDTSRVNIKTVQWCPKHLYLAAQGSNGVTIYEQAQAATAYHSEMSCVQLSAKELAVQSYRFDLSSRKLQSSLQIRGVAVSQPADSGEEYISQSLVMWDGESALVYEVNTDTKSVSQTAEFQCSSVLMCIYEQSIFSIEPTKLQVRNLQGVVKQLLTLPSGEKTTIVTSMNINGSSLVVSTLSSQVMLFNLSKREAKIDRPARHMKDLIPKLTHIKSCKVNSNGKLVSLIVDEDVVQGSDNSEPSSRLYVWDTESDSVVFHDFSFNRVASASRAFADLGPNQTEDDDLMSQDSNDALLSSNHDVRREANSASKALGGRIPLSHFWSSDDPRILTCEALKVESKSASTVEHLGLSGAGGGGLDGSVNAGSDGLNSGVSLSSCSVVIAVFFVDIPTAPLLMLKDSFPMPDNCAKLIGFDVPFHYCLTKNVSKGGGAVVRLPMRDFTGFSDCDSSTKKAMMDFSFHIAYGNMDEAFRAIKLIKNESVWENMCRMCVKNQNLSVAKMCLGNMRNLKATHALRKAERADMEIPAQTAMLAIALGMREEAEKLLRGCGRFDLLNEIHQAQGEWDKAVSVAEKHDRIHLSTTHYNYARYIETQHLAGKVALSTGGLDDSGEEEGSLGDEHGRDYASNSIEKAIQLYEKAGTHHFDVPRMMTDNYSKLLNYIDNKNEPALYKWWAQFSESTASIDMALSYYEKANDILSMVRVLCYLERYDEAMQLCNRETSLEDEDEAVGGYGDATDRPGLSSASKSTAVSSASATKAACYYLAQQFETQYSAEQNPKVFQQAITYYMRAEAYTNACRLCKEAEDFDQLKNVASLGSLKDKLDAAKFLEAQDTQECRDKALQLYSMAGQGMKVAELTRGEQKAAVMDSIVAHLDESSSSPEQLKEFAKFFKDTGLYEKAINLYIQAKDYDAALTLLEEAASVDITDEMADKLCPDKSDKSVDTRQRNQLLTRLAYICQAQQKYTLAYKKFQQAGDINQGFKALLKSGDVELIFKTAKVSRKPELMIDAANYFKTLQWVQAEDVVMKIIELYQKAKAFELLALFYISCAELEMDQYQAYDKAMDALNEAEKELSRALPNNKDPVRIQSALTQIKHRAQLISTFLDNDVTTTDKEQVAKMNNALRMILEDANYQRFPRERDIYTRMLANFLATEQNQKAFHCLETLHSLEDGVKALRRLLPGGSEGGPTNQAVMSKVNMLVEKVCERIDRPELAPKFKLGVSQVRMEGKSKALNETDDDVDESGDENERELDEALDD